MFWRVRLLIFTGSLTVQWFANHKGGGPLQGRELDLVDAGQIIEAFAIDEELKSAGHWHFGQAWKTGLVPMTNTLDFQRCDKETQARVILVKL